MNTPKMLAERQNSPKSQPKQTSDPVKAYQRTVSNQSHQTLSTDTLEPKGHGRCFLISTSRKRLVQPLSARAPLPQDLEISECAQVPIPAFSSDPVVLHLCPTKSPILRAAPEFAVPEFHFLLSLNKGGGLQPTLMGEFPSLLHTRDLL